MTEKQTWTFDTKQSTPGHWVITFGGDWEKEDLPPAADYLLNQIRSIPKSVTLDAGPIRKFDSSFTALLLKLIRHFQNLEIEVNKINIPTAIEELLNLALSTFVREQAQHIEPDHSLSHEAGVATLSIAHGFGDMLGIIGETLRSVYEYITNKSRAPFQYVLNAMQTDGPDALSIVTLIGFLIGVTLAFIGSLELQKFGASIYVADLVMIGMARELAPLMAGIVMAGRSGAGIAASIGAMKADDEIDALYTMGIDPINYLVSPRTVALMTMMPVLVAYAYVLGNLGGGLIAIFVLDLSTLEYITQARTAVSFINFVVGLGKGVVFGYLIAIAGSLRGLNCERSAEGVGFATTSAVVTAIVLIIFCNVLIDVVLYAVGI